jgi:hypothetical protein
VLHCGRVRERRAAVDEKIQKILVIAKPDTSYNPRAVMIHTQKARVAHAAVVRTRRLFFVAFAAP